MSHASQSTPTRLSRRRAALSSSAGSGFTIAITVLQTFVLVPLCLRVLGTTTYGAWLAAAELLVWIQLLDVGIPNLVTQRVGAAVGRDDLDDAARWSATGFVILSGVALALLMAGLAGAPLVARWTGVPTADEADLIAAFRVGSVASAILLLFNGCVALSRGVQRTTAVAAAEVGAALTGLAVSVALLLAGEGLAALAYGMAARAVVALAGGVVFLGALPHPAGWVVVPSRRNVREALGLVPSMAGASVGYVLANNSDVVLVTTVFGPAAAAVYALTRRAIDGLRRVLDVLAWAVYGGFAHLVTADDQHRARGLLADILGFRLALACLAGALAGALNPSFVRLLFGPDNFGGAWLSAAFVVHMVASGQTFLANYLLRAAGEVRAGSHMLTAEAAARVTASAAGLLVVGLTGAPAASSAVSLVFLGAIRARLDAVLPPGPSPRAAGTWRTVALSTVVVVGCVVGASWTAGNWFEFVSAGAAAALVAGLLLWRFTPSGLRRHSVS